MDPRPVGQGQRLGEDVVGLPVEVVLGHRQDRLPPAVRITPPGTPSAPPRRCECGSRFSSFTSRVNVRSRLDPVVGRAGRNHELPVHDGAAPNIPARAACRRRRRTYPGLVDVALAGRRVCISNSRVLPASSRRAVPGRKHRSRTTCPPRPGPDLRGLRPGASAPSAPGQGRGRISRRLHVVKVHWQLREAWAGQELIDNAVAPRVVEPAAVQPEVEAAGAPRSSG